MKTFKLIALTIAFFATIAASQARSVLPIYVSSLRGFNAHSSHVIGQPKGGSVMLNLAAKKVSLRLMSSSSCPAGAYCFISNRMQIVGLNVELPLTGRQTDGCGSVVYTAQSATQQVQIIDNQNNRCFVGKKYVTEVSYKTMDSKTNTKVISYFGGDVLEVPASI